VLEDADRAHEELADGDGKRVALRSNRTSLRQDGGRFDGVQGLVEPGVRGLRRRRPLHGRQPLPDAGEGLRALQAIEKLLVGPGVLDPHLGLPVKREDFGTSGLPEPVEVLPRLPGEVGACVSRALTIH